ncbi:hypothetical protein [Paucibacter soli]|uniref:hypothetical protein n=1 Tax=Paucibacter soli TaxID=3133433 RepID=UPI0030A5AECE
MIGNFDSLMAVLLNSPLFAGLVAASIALAGYRYLQVRRDAPMWASLDLLETEQFRVATPSEIEWFIAAAEREGKRPFATARLAEARSRNGGELRLGQLWWTWWQVRGLIGSNLPAPSCRSKGDGIEDEGSFAKIEGIPLSSLMKSW